MACALLIHNALVKLQRVEERDRETKRKRGGVINAHLLDRLLRHQEVEIASWPERHPRNIFVAAASKTQHVLPRRTVEAYPKHRSEKRGPSSRWLSEHRR